ncbi:MAG: glycoside hydrolase family 76 protein [Candidatus Xenobia bacterium]
MQISSVARRVVSPYAPASIQEAPASVDSVDPVVDAPDPARAHSKRWMLGAAALSAMGIIGAVEGQIPTYSPMIVQALHDQTSSSRADASWQALQQAFATGNDLSNVPGNSLTHTFFRSAVWPYGQAMAAALDQARVTGNYQEFNQLVAGLQAYRLPGGGYAPGTLLGEPHGKPFYDDNAWIGLDFVQAYNQTHDAAYLHQAEEVFNFLKTGIQPNGGMVWQEGNPHPTYNTCVLGPVTELALRLHQATGGKDPQYLQIGTQLYNITEQHLRLPNGLYADHMDPDFSHRDDTVYSYNQGTPVGASLLFYQITGDRSYLQRAQADAAASLRYYGSNDRLWQASPAFNAIYLRNLMQLNAVSPLPTLSPLLQAYLNRAWTDGRDPATGLFTPANGMGQYGHEPHGDLLDQSGMVQLYSLDAQPPQELGNVS